MTLNEKFRNVSGISLDVEGMIATCPVDQKEKLYNDLDWHIGLLHSTCCAEGKYTSDGSDRAETLKEIYNLLISIPVVDPAEINSAFEELVPGVHKSISIDGNLNSDKMLSVANGCEATINIPAESSLNVAGSETFAGFSVLGNLEVDCAGEIIGNMNDGKGSRIFTVANGGSLKIDSGKFSSNIPVDANVNGKVEINGGEFNSIEPCVIFAKNNVEVVINGGEFTAVDNGVLMGNGSTGNNSNVVKINGGVYNAGIKSTGYIACGIYCPNADVIEIDGATFNITDGCCICSRAGKVSIKNTTINMKYTSKALVAGKVGDSRVVVPCVPFVFDEAATYPGLDSDAKIEIGENVVINWEGEYEHSGKKACLISGTSKEYESKFDEEIESRIFGI